MRKMGFNDREVKDSLWIMNNNENLAVSHCGQVLSKFFSSPTSKRFSKTNSILQTASANGFSAIEDRSWKN